VERQRRRGVDRRRQLRHAERQPDHRHAHVVAAHLRLQAGERQHECAGARGHSRAAAGNGPASSDHSFYSPSNSPYSFAQHTTTDIIDLVWTSRNTPSGATFNLDWALDGGAHTLITGVTSPYSHLSTGTGGHGLDIVNGGTASRMRYTLIMKDGSGNEVAVATLDIEVDHV
jgi:hypothetical protein